MKPPKGWKIKTDNKLRGAYGETDFDKKLIRINKRKHRSSDTKRLTPNKDGSENLLTTIAHEFIHAKHPKKSEKATERLARAMTPKMSQKTKNRIYASVK